MSVYQFQYMCSLRQTDPVEPKLAADLAALEAQGLIVKHLSHSVRYSVMDNYDIYNFIVLAEAA